MKATETIFAAIVAVSFLHGCVSSERWSEYQSWRQSEDGIVTASFDEFEAKYKNGWRERAAEKKSKRIALERRKAEYSRWLASDDKVDGVSLEVFEQKHKKGWETRAERKKVARLAREAKEHLEAKRRDEEDALKRKRKEFLDAIVKEDLAAIRKAYSEGEQYGHKYESRGMYAELGKAIRANKGEEAYKKIKLEIERHKHSDWLKDWVEPRTGLSAEDKLAGEALLAEFGTKHMPNAYANYEKVKESAKEIQQIFNEEFPEPWELGEKSPKWTAFNKLLERFARIRTEYFLCHDELCHYWSYYRLGVLTNEDFARIDSQGVVPRLLPEVLLNMNVSPVERNPAKQEVCDFAAKYAPESFELYQRLEQEFNQCKAFSEEVGKQFVLLDFVRYNRALHNLISKHTDLARELNALASDFENWRMLHRTMEKSSEDVAKLDRERSIGLKKFAATVRTYVKDRTLGRVIPEEDMILLPKTSFSYKLNNQWYERLAFRPHNRDRAAEEFTAEVKHVCEEIAERVKRGKLCVDAKEFTFSRESVGKELLAAYRKVEALKQGINLTINSIRMQRTEVTQMQWLLVMGNIPCERFEPDCPVYGVSEGDCHVFIRKLAEMDGVRYRLPTDYEWEYACRAGSSGQWGRCRNGQEGSLELMAWDLSWRNRNRKPRAVATKEPNIWGLYDMHGNVDERVIALPALLLFDWDGLIFRSGCILDGYRKTYFGYLKDGGCDSPQEGFRLVVSDIASMKR